jgi:antitoxin MazE
METKLQRWGNSLGLRIPKTLAQEAGVKAGSTVELAIEDGRLVVRPARRRYDLGKLVGQITEANLHEAIDTGEPVGREAW